MASVTSPQPGIVIEPRAIPVAVVNLDPPTIVVSSTAPSNTDGRPDGTIYIQTP